MEAAPPETAEADAAPAEETVELPLEQADAPEAEPAETAGQPMPSLNLPSSLEGSIKEMIKPLLIQWLNDNLPRIVEEAVREELTDRTELAEIRKRSRV
jgi:hypothetical protein